MKSRVLLEVLALVLLSLVLVTELHTQQIPPAPGERVRVRLNASLPDAGEMVIGEVTSVSDSEFTLFTPEGFQIGVRRETVESLELSRGHTPLLLRMGVGAGVGGLLGYTYGFLAIPREDEFKGFGEMITTSVGAVVGWIVGMYYQGRERWEPVGLPVSLR